MLRWTAEECVESLESANCIPHRGKYSASLFGPMMQQRLGQGRTVLEAHAVADASDAFDCLKTEDCNDVKWLAKTAKENEMKRKIKIAKVNCTICKPEMPQAQAHAQTDPGSAAHTITDSLLPSFRLWLYIFEVYCPSLASMMLAHCLGEFLVIVDLDLVRRSAAWQPCSFASISDCRWPIAIHKSSLFKSSVFTHFASRLC